VGEIPDSVDIAPEQSLDFYWDRICLLPLTGPVQICDSFFFNHCKFAPSFILTKAANY